MSEANKPVGLLNNLVYATPTSGTIRLGYTRKTDNGVLPVKDDQFRITTKVKDRATGNWVPHPLDAALREKHGEAAEGSNEGADRKLRRIPVTIVYDRPELTVSEQFAAFNNQGVPLCVGNGETASRRDLDTGGTTQESCTPRSCEFGKRERCDAFMRMLVRVEGQEETAPPMILRTGSVNAVTDNRTTLEYWARMFRGRLAGLPFTLVLETKQSAMSRQSRFFFARLEPAFKTAVAGAKILADARQDEDAAGIDRAAAEEALLLLRNHGSYAEDTDDGAAQFDDLIAGRFTQEVDGEQHQVTIGLPSGGVQQSPRESAAAAMMELNARLGGARKAPVPAAPEQQAERSEQTTAA